MLFLYFMLFVGGWVGVRARVRACVYVCVCARARVCVCVDRSCLCVSGVLVRPRLCLPVSARAKKRSVSVPQELAARHSRKKRGQERAR